MRNIAENKRSLRRRGGARRSGKSGVGSLEVAISSFLMIALAAIAVDATIFFLAFTINDNCARDCARAAGSVPSSQQKETLAQAQANALAAAQNQLQVHSVDGHLITGINGESHPTLLTSASQYVYNTNGWPPQQTLVNGSPSAPYVTCTTAVLVHVPVGFNFFGVTAKVNATNQLQMTRSYTFPIVTTQLGN